MTVIDTSGYTVLTVSLYRDITGIPLGNVIVVDEFDYNSSSNHYEYATTLTINRNAALSTSLLPFFPYGVEVGVFVDSLPITPSNKCLFVFNFCCRNAAIINATNPGTQSMVLYTYYWPGIPTPVFMSLPITYFPLNHQATYNPFPYSPSPTPDSLVWSLKNSIGTATYTTTSGSVPSFADVAGFTTPPAASSGPFSLNPVTGEITWTPNAIGNFIQAVEVKQYPLQSSIGLINTVERDMQFVIVPDTSADTITLTPVSPYNVNNSPYYKYAYYTPGQPFTFQINGTCPNPNINLTLNSFSNIYSYILTPATFTSTGITSTVSGTINWSPPIYWTKDVIVVFRLRGGMFSKDFTLLLRKNPGPNNIPGTYENEINLCTYPNPAHNNLNLSMELTQNIEADISLYSIIGQNVLNIYKGKLLKGKNNLSTELKLVPGIYSLVIRDEEKRTVTKPIVIQ